MEDAIQSIQKSWEGSKVMSIEMPVGHLCILSAANRIMRDALRDLLVWWIAMLNSVH